MKQKFTFNELVKRPFSILPPNKFLETNFLKINLELPSEIDFPFVAVESLSEILFKFSTTE